MSEESEGLEGKIGSEDARKAWNSAVHFKDICELTAKFIEGTMPLFPGYSADTVAKETEDLIPYLASFNRSGFLTTTSQPGEDDPDWKQRAFVDGFAQEKIARKIAKVSLHSELHIVAVPPGYSAGFHTPVILREFMPHGWSGFSSFDELDFFEEYCNPDAMAELRMAWSISIIDLKWGRDDYLWPTICKAICYSERPHPDLGLDFDFAI